MTEMRSKKKMKNREPEKKSSGEELEDAVPSVYRFGGDMEDLAVEGLLHKVTLYSVKFIAREFGFKRKNVELAIRTSEVQPTRTIKFKKFGGVKVQVYRLRDVLPLMYAEGAHAERRGRPKKNVNETDEVRLLRARADKAELELEEMKGGLHRENDVIRDVGDMLAAFRAKIMSLPTKLAGLLPADQRQEFEALLRKDVNGALSELSEYRPKLHHTSRANGSASAGADGKSVGGSLS